MRDSSLQLNILPVSGNLSLIKGQIVCPKCGSISHDWHQVYISENSKLKEIENSLITECDTINEYVLIKRNQRT